MSQNDDIEFECIKDGCKEEIGISLRHDGNGQQIVCSGCRGEYHLDKSLIEKLKAFEALVQTVKKSRDILGQTSVGVTVGTKTVKIPYRLLLTRMTTMLDLKIGDQALTFRFRVEPLTQDEIKSIT